MTESAESFESSSQHMSAFFFPVLSFLLMCCLCLSRIIPHVLDGAFFSISSFYVSSVLCYNHSSSINSSLLHLPKTWIVSNSFTTIRGSTLRANMSGVEHKEERVLSCPDVISSNGTWNLGVKYCLGACTTQAFFITRWEILVRVSPESGPERFGKKKTNLCRSKKYKPWSLYLTELCLGLLLKFEILKFYQCFCMSASPVKKYHD